jgi:hypothetical protein
MAPSTNTRKTELELSLEVNVHYEHYPATHGRREAGSGVPLEPDFPEQVEITHVYASQKGGKPVDILDLLSESEVISLEDEILESMRG